jgi:hypothetical protein
MDRYGFVTTPSALARELVTAFQRSPLGPYHVFAIRGLAGVALPPGSEVVYVPTYSGFQRFLQRNGITKIVFVARLNMAPLFWIQALCHLRFLSLFVHRDILSPGGLHRLRRGVPPAILRFIKEDLDRMKIDAVHPHWINGDEFKLLTRDCTCRMSDTETNQIRILMTEFYSSGSHSVLTLSEACLVGLPSLGPPELIAVERRGTDELMDEISPAHRLHFRRIVLVKNGLDPSLIAYPVIGTDTVRRAKDRGITDIMVSMDCVIQGKMQTIGLARGSGIGIKHLEIG